MVELSSPSLIKNFPASRRIVFFATISYPFNGSKLNDILFLIISEKAIIYLFEKELIEPPSFRSIEDSVRAEYSKRMDDKSLRDYLENLKNWYDISRNPPK